MASNWWNRFVTRNSKRPATARRFRGDLRKSKARPVIECLEDRTLLSTTIPVGTNPHAIVTADFTGSGIQDLAVANSGANSVSILMGTGQGTFQNETSYGAGTNPVALAAGQLIPGGKQDLVVADAGQSGTGAGLTILLGKGDGTFEAPAYINVGLTPSSLTLADLTNNGTPDIIVAGDAVNSSGATVGEIDVLMGKGDGTFEAPFTYATGLNPTGITTGDFTHSGYLDIASVNNGGDLPAANILINNKNGTFHEGGIYSAGFSPDAVIAGDWAGNGNIDLAVSNSAGTIRILMNRGDGAFGAPLPIYVGNDPTDIQAVDFSGTGRPDLVVTEAADNSVAILYNLGDGWFGHAVNYAVGNTPSAVVGGSFMGDGKPDLAIANAASNSVSLFAGSSLGDFLTITSQQSTLTGTQFEVTVTAYSSVGVVNTGYLGTVHFMSNDSTAILPADYTFTAADGGVHTFSLTLNKIGFHQIDAADTTPGSPSGSTSLLVRGTHFIVVGSSAGDVPMVRVYDAGTGMMLYSFDAFNRSFTGGVRVALGDVDGDGVPDIIVSPGPGHSPEVRVFSMSNFRMIEDFMAYAPNFTGGIFVASGDVSGNGYDDIITSMGKGGTSQVKVFDGKTDNVVYSFMAYGKTFDDGVRVAAGDVNGDGHADIITSPGAGGGSLINVFSGATGQLMESFSAFPSTDQEAVFVAAGDLTGNGKADIIVGLGKGGSPEVKAFQGDDPSVVLQNFMPFNADFDGGVRVGYVGSLTGKGPGDILVGAGPGGTGQVELLNGESLDSVDNFVALPAADNNGVLVAGW